MQLQKLFSLAMAGMTCLPTAFAQGPYIDVGFTGTETEYYMEGRLDDLQTGHIIEIGANHSHVGYALSPYLGIEGEALLGIASDTYDDEYVLDDDVVEFETTLKLKSTIGVFARANLPIEDPFTVFARAGYAAGEFETSSNLTDTGTEQHSGDGFALGFGGNFDLTNKVYVRVEYTNYDLDEAEIDAYQASIGMRF